jgi:hypothetical protein
MIFPAERLRRAGASDSELTQLQSEYDESSPAAKESLVTHLEAVVDQDIREWVDDLRKIGHFGGKPEQIDAEKPKPKPKPKRKTSEPATS